MNRYVIYTIIIFLGIGADQWTKEWIVDHIHSAKDFFHYPPFFSVVRTHNTGISFGLFKDFHLGPLVYAGAVGCIILFLIYMIRTNKRMISQLAFTLMISGAIGNLIDRFTRGYVVDFISAHWYDKYYFYVFNVADILVSCGAGLILLDALLDKRKS